MTVHAISGYLSADSGMTDSEVQTQIDDWVSKRVKWDGGDWDGQVSRRNTKLDGSGTDYLAIAVRFTWDSADKDNTLQKFEDKFVNKIDWYRVAYHQCDHDESDRSGCAWDESREWTAKDVTIPPGVPTFT